MPIPGEIRLCLIYSADSEGSEMQAHLQAAGYSTFNLDSRTWFPPVDTPAATREAQVVIAFFTSSLLRRENPLRLLESIAGFAHEHGTPLIITVDQTPVGSSLPDWTVQSPVVVAAEDETAEELASRVVSVIAVMRGAKEAQLADKKEFQERVERQLDVHIRPVLERLSAEQTSLQRASTAFYSVALITLVVGLLFAIVRAWQAHFAQTQTWTQIGQSSISSIIVIGMLSAVARLSFVLGRSFMVESLTNGDRAHAISFGRFYLQAFGDKATWPEVQEAFKDWNVERGGSFATQAPSDVDPLILQALVEAAKNVGLLAKPK